MDFWWMKRAKKWMESQSERYHNGERERGRNETNSKESSIIIIKCRKNVNIETLKCLFMWCKDAFWRVKGKNFIINDNRYFITVPLFSLFIPFWYAMKCDRRLQVKTISRELQTYEKDENDDVCRENINVTQKQKPSSTNCKVSLMVLDGVCSVGFWLWKTIHFANKEILERDSTLFI